MTQSGSGLPSADSPRTVEFWSRTADCQASEAVQYGDPSTANGEFDVQVNAGNCDVSRLVLSTAGQSQSASWALPASWDDGAWHLYDLTYDGTTVTAYMDGQVVGSSALTMPLATVTPGDGFSVNVAAHPTKPDAIAEVAVYPAALTSQKILAHWEARYTLPAGVYLIAGTAAFGNGSGAAGAREEACPTARGSCIVGPYPADPSGFFHLLAPAGTYTVTLFPPSGSPSGSQTITAVTVPASVLNLSATFSPPGGLPPGVSFSTPTGTQQNQVPRVNWSEPSTVTDTACTGGIGLTSVTSTNPATGQPETTSAPLLETPTGSGTYQATIPPLAPQHGAGSGTDSIICPAKLGLLPSGGPSGGGTTVLLNAPGGLTGATAVTFGSRPATSFTVVTDNFIEATAPPGSGSAPVTVTASSGNSISIGTYTYFQVSSLSVGSGPATGGTTVTITGEGFAQGDQVLFGLAASQSVTVVSPTEIQAVAPPGVGTVDVQVVQGNSVSEAGSQAAYVNENGPPGTASLNQTATSPQNYATQISEACAADVAGVTLVEQDAQLCGAADLAKDLYDEGSGALRDIALDKAEDILPGFFAYGVKNLFNSIADGTAFLEGVNGVLDVVDAINAIFDPIAKAQFIISVGDDVCKILTGSGCRWDFWTLFIDPGGTVIDTNGNPINGATATLLGQPATSGAFSTIDPASGAIEPATNPETTGASGAFDWEALAGTYEVEASAPGCYAPGDPSQPSVFTSPFGIPPPAVGLTLALECAGSTPVRAAVTALTPSSGPTVGGSVVDITGTGLAGATSVSFGGQPVTHLQVLSPYAIAAIAPAGSGTVDVTVTTRGGTSPTTVADHYSYVAPVAVQGGPVVTNVAPANGPLVGGTPVTITGTNLNGAYAVDFGSTSAASVTDVSDTEIHAVAPAAAFSSRVDISVTTPLGYSAPTLSDAFVYGSPTPPVASSVAVVPSPSTVVAGSQVALAADVTPTDGAGTVAFYADGAGSAIAGCESQALALAGAGYQAMCTTSDLGPGTHTITASYSGDANYAASSGSTSVMVVAAPANTTLPTISGTTGVGQTLTCSPGAWSYSPTAYGYQWQLDGGDIAGATSATYVVEGADLGHTLACRVTATNLAGSVAATSSGVVIPPAQTVSTTSAATTIITSTTHTSSGGVHGNTVVTPKPLTRAQKLAAAIRLCDKLKRKSKRARCVAAARKRFAPTPTRAQSLAAAIKACDKLKRKRERATCIAAAKKRYPLRTAGPRLTGTFVVW